MSGLYLIGVVATWVCLTWLLLRFGWRMLVREKDVRSVRAAFVIIAILVWLGASFWYGGGRKYYYDWRVERMCAVDGGVKVYETVLLPATEYEKYARRNWVLPDRSRAESGDKYYRESATTYLRDGSPKIVRMHTRIIRRNDGKVLGESTYYGRGGGDLYGPWHPSGFTCPDPTKSSGFATRIFTKGE